MARALRRVPNDERRGHQAVNEDADLDALEMFEAPELGKRYPSAVKSFRDAWERFTPFLALPPALRRVIYTTNSIAVRELQGPQETRRRLEAHPLK